MKKLLKSYGYFSDMQYYEMIVWSVINDQRSQARKQFKAMPRANKKQFVVSIVSGYWQHGMDASDYSMFIYLI